jgi:hypothetical protein
MKATILRKRFFDTAVADVLRALDGRSLIGAASQALCLIDYLTYLRTGAIGNIGENYEASIEEIFTKKIDSRYRSKWIYALRCALVHTYARANAMKKAGLDCYLFKHLEPTFHLSGNDTTLRVNVDTFVADTIWACWLFFEEPALAIEQRGDELLVVQISDSEAQKPYAHMHRALCVFDEKDPSLLAMREAVRKVLQ